MRIPRGVLLGLSCALALAFSATAAVITVTDAGDAGDGTLRKAITDSAPGGTINFAAGLDGKTIRLTSGPLVINKNLTIDGTANGVQEITLGGNLAGVLHVTAGEVELFGLTVRDGYAMEETQGGGGLWVAAGATVVVGDSTFIENISAEGGGAIRNDGTLLMGRCTISGNIAVFEGGGIANAGFLTLISSTVSGNRGALGGGVANVGSDANTFLTLATVARNAAQLAGGGLYRAATEFGSVTIEGSLIGENDASSGPDCAGYVVSNGYNLVSRTDGCVVDGVLTGNQMNVAPRLGGLMPNGRLRTFSHALLSGSPAVDAIPAGTGPCTGANNFDQRNLIRPADGDASGTAACDTGAYERTRPIVVNSLADPSETGKCTLRNALAAASTNAVSGSCLAGLGGLDTILIAVNGTIPVSTEISTFAEPVEVVGPGADRLVLSGLGADRIFLVVAPAVGVYTFSGLTFADSVVSYPLHVQGAAALGIDRCLFRDNTPSGPSNFVAASTRKLEARDTTFVHRVQTGSGINLRNVKASFTSCTFESTGSVPSSASVLLNAGTGEFTDALFTHCTFRGSGRGLQATSFPAAAATSVLRYRGTVFSGSSGSNVSVLDATAISLGNNVSNDASGNLVIAFGDAPSTDPKLGRLRWNGGTVPTIGLLAGSPALERVPSSFCFPTTDARGVSRARDGDASGPADCDAGAFEATRPIVVNSLLDPTDPAKCTLRDAITAANTNGVSGGCAAGAFGLDTIRFAPGLSGTLALPIGAVTVNESLLVEGPGADRLAVSGGGSGIFVFSAGARPASHAVQDLTVRNGNAAYGGGIRAAGAENALAVDGCDFVDNRATTNGGSMYVESLAAFHASSSAFRNTAGPSTGTDGVAATNTAAWLTNCTFGESMSAFEPFGVVSIGLDETSEATLSHCTFQGTEVYGPAAYAAAGASPGSAVLRYRGLVVAGYASSNIDVSLGGSGISLGYNVSDDASGNLTATGDLPSTDPKLGALVRNGGPTPTFSLKSDSPAVNRVPLADCRPVYDQRGLGRPSGAGCDSGAFERTPVGDVNGDGSVNVSDVLYLINFLFAGGPSPVGTANVNVDGAVNVTDVLYLINFLFAGGPAPV